MLRESHFAEEAELSSTALLRCEMHHIHKGKGSNQGEGGDGVARARRPPPFTRRAYPLLDSQNKERHQYHRILNVLPGRPLKRRQWLPRPPYVFLVC